MLKLKLKLTHRYRAFGIFARNNAVLNWHIAVNNAVTLCSNWQLAQEPHNICLFAKQYVCNKIEIVFLSRITSNGCHIEIKLCREFTFFRPHSQFSLLWYYFFVLNNELSLGLCKLDCSIYKMECSTTGQYKSPPFWVFVFLQSVICVITDRSYGLDVHRTTIAILFHLITYKQGSSSRNQYHWMKFDRTD